MPTKIEETEILLRKVLKKHYIFFFLGISLVNLFFELIFGRSKTGPQTDVAFVLTCCGFLTQTCANLWGSVGIMGNNWYFVTKIVLTYCEKKIVLVIEKNF